MIIALIIFVLAYAGIISEKFPRHWVALLGGAMLILFGVLSPAEAFFYISWETLGLISGMFILVSILNEAGFFSWLAMTAVKKVNYHPASLFAVLILLSAVLAMFMGSITVMLFLAALTVQLCRLLRLDPVPLIIAEVCAANTGGAGTLIGDPPNMVLGSMLGYGFSDFFENTGPISIIAAFLLLGVFYFTNRKILKDSHKAMTKEVVAEIESLHNEPIHAHLTRVGVVGFISAVVLLILRVPVSNLTGLPINGAVSALIPAIIALIAIKDQERKTVILKVDIESILFFAGLFVLIGGLEKVHVFGYLAESLAGGASQNQAGFVMALHWLPGIASGIVDNVPLALAMGYVLKDLASIPGMPALALMVWSLALGVDIGGNFTPIGASSNVVAYAYMEKNHGSIGWKRWLLIATPPTIIVMIFASLSIFIKGQIGWF